MADEALKNLLRRHPGERLRLRIPTAEEIKQLQRLAATGSRERLRRRARLILKMVERPFVSAGVAGLWVGYDTRVPGYQWAKRFNEGGVAALEDLPRPGPSAAYLEGVRQQRDERLKEKGKDP